MELVANGSIISYESIINNESIINYESIIVSKRGSAKRVKG